MSLLLDYTDFVGHGVHLCLCNVLRCPYGFGTLKQYLDGTVSCSLATCVCTLQGPLELVSVFFHMHSIPCGFFNVEKVLVLTVLSKPQNTNTY